MQPHSNTQPMPEKLPETSGFDAFPLPHALARSLQHMKYTQPTPIQMQAIPAVLKNKDILGSAQTGTGKTGAFVIPILAKLMNDPHQNALVMAPTRELAAQILQVVRQMSHGHSAITTALLIGGEGMGKQRAQIAAKPRFIIGTPGRMNDHLRDNPRMYMKTTMLVLDEADRMLDMGFAPQIKDIIETTNPQRQTLMFSATFPPNIVKFAQQYLRDPIRITIEPERTSAALIKHEELHTSEGARYTELVKQLQDREGSIIVFIKTKHGADRMAKRLHEQAKLSVDAIHGGLNQRQRDRAIAGFRNGKTRIMIATDVAARGLDVPHIEHVINYDLPQVPEDYVHRIGRTGRNGKEGVALSFIMPSEMGKWRAIQRILNPNTQRSENEKRPNKFKPNDRVHQNKPRDDFRGRKNHKADAGARFRVNLDETDFAESPSAPMPARKPFGDKPRFDKNKRFDKPRFDKPRFDKPRGEGNAQPRAEREANGNTRERETHDPNGIRSDRSDRPQRHGTGKPFGKKPFGQKKFFGKKQRFERKA